MHGIALCTQFVLRAARTFRTAPCLAFCFAAPLGFAQEEVESDPFDLEGPVLDATHAEHMFNRFGFGARPGEIDAVVGMRSTELFDLWVEYSVAPETPTPHYTSEWEYGYDANSYEIEGAPINQLPLDQQIEKQRAYRLADRQQFRDYTDSVFDEMVESPSPLRARLALFWHGFFPTSSKSVLRRYELILQYHFFRSNAIGGFDDLLHGIIEDPAMLSYFDNDTNGKSHPNENFARELMELYSLGVGNYTEEDVRDAARALTGYQGETGKFVFDEELHDFGEKTILGQTGEFDGTDLVKILLQQDACAAYVSRRLLTWIEGVPPTAARVEQYAEWMRDLDYEITPWLRRLAADPEFFRPGVVGNRVQGPIELLASTSRRLKIQGRSTFLFFAATMAGQQFYGPPSVKGWDEGSAWITSSSMIVRGNCAGFLVGHLQEHVDEEEGEAPASEAVEKIKELRATLRAYGRKAPKLVQHARRAIGMKASDEELLEWIAGAYLARDPDQATLDNLRTEMLWCRSHFGVEGPLLKAKAGDRVLRHLVYTLLRSPIAQLG
jgi:uncharacterized protein (DUF1800 family)